MAQKETDILHLGICDCPKDLIKKALLDNCKNNKKLRAFINKLFKNNPDVEILAWEDYGWEWDVECYGIDGGEVAICNHDYRDDVCYESDGWELYNLEHSFSNYFDNFNWQDITLDNGKYLLLLDEDDHLTFHIFDKEKMEDGKVDFYGITWPEE
jgi:hypothetical protein